MNTTLFTFSCDKPYFTKCILYYNKSMVGVRVGNYVYKKSTRPDKKLMVTVKSKDGDKTIHFGSRDMEHFRDKTGIWKSKDHGDETRRRSYLRRAKGIKNKAGELTWKNPMSANYHAVRILW